MAGWPSVWRDELVDDDGWGGADNSHDKEVVAPFIACCAFRWQYGLDREIVTLIMKFFNADGWGSAPRPELCPLPMRYGLDVRRNDDGEGASGPGGAAAR
eukprot:SAG11_NODE_5761_length_1468_cov_5.615778_2_plen_100_part_00